jgi:hypothetical protein
MPKLDNRDDELFCREVVKGVKQGKSVGEVFQELHPYIENGTAASSIARQKIESSREIAGRISEILDKQHLSLLYANKKLSQHLEARKPFLAGDVVEYTEDWSAQDRALEKLYKLHGLLGNNVQIDARQVHFNSLNNMSQEQMDRLEGILVGMDKLADKLDMKKNKVEYKGEGTIEGSTGL